jgi:hypothetical protein
MVEPPPAVSLKLQAVHRGNNTKLAVNNMSGKVPSTSVRSNQHAGRSAVSAVHTMTGGLRHLLACAVKIQFSATPWPRYAMNLVTIAIVGNVSKAYRCATLFCTLNNDRYQSRHVAGQRFCRKKYLGLNNSILRTSREILRVLSHLLL